MDSAAIPSTMKRAFWYTSIVNFEGCSAHTSAMAASNSWSAGSEHPTNFNIDGLRIGRPFLKGSITPVIYVYINVCEFYVKNSILSYPKKKQYGFSMSP